MSQTMTITKKMEDANQHRMNKSTISKEDRPTTPFGQDNPFNLSKMGYANPVAIERALPSAMKSRPKILRTPSNGDQIQFVGGDKSGV